MAHGVIEARNSFERLEINQASSGPGNLTIQTPDNVTLVLNFSGGYPGVQNMSPPENRSIPGFTSPPVCQTTSTGSQSSSPTDDLSSNSPSESPSSSSPSSPEFERASATTPIATEKKLKSALRARRSEPAAPKKPLPSKESLSRFLSSQGQVHTTVSLSEVNHTDAYSENWVKKKHYLSFTKHHRIRDIKFDGDCNVLLASRHSVQLYDANGHFLERLYRDKVQEPWGLHVHDNGNVFVSDHKNDCVKEFNHIGLQLQKYGPVPSPCGVAVSSSNYVFVCSRTDACVYVFDRHGKLVRKIGERTLTSPAYVVLHGKLVLVSDEARIIGFTTDNDISFVYGHADKINHPASLCVDRKTGFALATAYYKGSIIAVKKDRTRALMVKDATRPILCAISPYGHLLVGERLSKGVLFKMYRGGKD